MSKIHKKAFLKNFFKKYVTSPATKGAVGTGEFLRNIPEKTVSVGLRQFSRGPALIGAKRLDPISSSNIREELKKHLKKNLKKDFEFDPSALKDIERGTKQSVDLKEVLKAKAKDLEEAGLANAKVVRGPLGGFYLSPEDISSPLDMLKSAPYPSEWVKGFKAAMPDTKSVVGLDISDKPEWVRRAAGFGLHPATLLFGGMDAYNTLQSGDIEEYKRFLMQRLPSLAIGEAASRLGGKRYGFLPAGLAWEAADTVLGYNPLLSNPEKIIKEPGYEEQAQEIAPVVARKYLKTHY